MNIIDTLEAIEAAPLGNERLAALKAGDSQDLRKALTWALSPEITFGIKKLPAAKSDSVGTTDFMGALEPLLRDLADRKLSGNAASEAVAAFLTQCDEKQAKWARRIISQDLRVNIGAKEVNNTIGALTIFQFAVPLATDYKKVKGDLKGRWAVEPKLDGARTVAYLPANNGRVRLLSRTGKEYHNFESVRARLQEINATRNQALDIVLDGEVVSLNSEGGIDFQGLQQTLFRKDSVEVGALKLLIFDATTKADWERPSKTYAERYAYAEDFVRTSIHDVSGAVNKIGIVPMFISVAPSREQMESYNRQYVERGYEGAMLRAADVPVDMKRSKNLLKVKSFMDAEASVVGAVVGTGKYDSMLGALECVTADGVRFEIGSGFSDAQRQAFWRDRKSLPKTVNYKYFEVTNDPVFRYFRHEDDIS